MKRSRSCFAFKPLNTLCSVYTRWYIPSKNYQVPLFFVTPNGSLKVYYAGFVNCKKREKDKRAGGWMSRGNSIVENKAANYRFFPPNCFMVVKFKSCMTLCEGQVLFEFKHTLYPVCCSPSTLCVFVQLSPVKTETQTCESFSIYDRDIDIDRDREHRRGTWKNITTTIFKKKTKKKLTESRIPEEKDTHL